MEFNGGSHQVSWVGSTGRKICLRFIEASPFSATAQLQDLTQGGYTYYGPRNCRVLRDSDRKGSMTSVTSDSATSTSLSGG